MDFVYFMVGVLGAVCAIWTGCVVLFDDYCENRPLMAVLCLFGCGGVYYAFAGDEPAKAFAAAAVQSEAREAECQRVKLAATEDGVNLYVYQPRCGAEPVYFSKSGTQTTEVRRSGKVTHRIIHSVPNAQEE